MKLRQLESALQQVPFVDRPKIELEQYPTPAGIAAAVLYTAQMQFSDIDGLRVMDLGCGGGILSVAAALCGASALLCVDVDEAALATTRASLDDFDVLDDDSECAVTFVREDVLKWVPGVEHEVDTVVMNPPFGTRFAGADVAFLERAVICARRSVYSLHKSSTRDFLMRKAESFGAAARVVAELRYNVEHLYAFHRRESRDIEVDLIRLDVSAPACDAWRAQRREALAREAAAGEAAASFDASAAGTAAVAPDSASAGVPVTRSNADRLERRAAKAAARAMEAASSRSSSREDELRDAATLSDPETSGSPAHSDGGGSDDDGDADLVHAYRRARGAHGSGRGRGRARRGGLAPAAGVAGHGPARGRRR